MIVKEKPYFLTNKKWYLHDAKTGVYKLTRLAPPKAVKSYREFYRLLKSTTIAPDEKERHDVDKN